MEDSTPTLVDFMVYVDSDFFQPPNDDTLRSSHQEETINHLHRPKNIAVVKQKPDVHSNQRKPYPSLEGWYQGSL